MKRNRRKKSGLDDAADLQCCEKWLGMGWAWYNNWEVKVEHIYLPKREKGYRLVGDAFKFCPECGRRLNTFKCKKVLSARDKYFPFDGIRKK